MQRRTLPLLWSHVTETFPGNGTAFQTSDFLHLIHRIARGVRLKGQPSPPGCERLRVGTIHRVPRRFRAIEPTKKGHQLWANRHSNQFSAASWQPLQGHPGMLALSSMTGQTSRDQSLHTSLSLVWNATTRQLAQASAFVPQLLSNVASSALQAVV